MLTCFEISQGEAYQTNCGKLEGFEAGDNEGKEIESNWRVEICVLAVFDMFLLD
jgi:hypothetical protein